MTVQGAGGGGWAGAGLTGRPREGWVHLCRAEMSKMASGGGHREPPRQGAGDRLCAQGPKDRWRAAPGK